MGNEKKQTPVNQIIEIDVVKSDLKKVLSSHKRFAI